MQKIGIICGASRFRVYIPDNTWYSVAVRVSIETGTEPLLREIERLLEDFLPVNLQYQVVGDIVRSQGTGVYAGAAGSLYVKIKAGPESPQFFMAREVPVRMGTGTIEHIRASYVPEKEE